MTQQSLLQRSHRNLVLRTNFRPVLNVSLRSPTKLQVGIWAVILILSLAICIRDFHSFQFGAYQDDAQYALLARSLVYSKAYGLADATAEPLVSEHPFGFPLLLAPIIALWPGNLDALKSISLVATIVNVTLLFWGWHWLSRTTSYWWAVGVAGLYALSPVTVVQTRTVLSEPIFTMFCLMALILTEKIAHDKHNFWSSTMLSIVLLSVLLTRTVGLALIGSVFVYLVLVKRFNAWKELVLIPLQMVGLLLLLISFTPASMEDVIPTQFKRIATTSEPLASIQTASENHLTYVITRHLGVDVRDAVMPLVGGPTAQALANRIGLPSLPLVVGLVLSALIIVGSFLWLLREKILVSQLFLALYACALWVWVWEEARFLYPILPLLWFTLLVGIQQVAVVLVSVLHRKVSIRRLINGALAILVVCMMMASAYQSLRLDDTRRHVGDVQARTSWFASHTATSAVVMSEFSITDAWYAERMTARYPARDSTIADLIQHLSRYNVNYILVAPNISWQSNYSPNYSRRAVALLPLFEELVLSNRLSLVYSSNRDLVKIYQVN